MTLIVDNAGRPILTTPISSFTRELVPSCNVESVTKVHENQSSHSSDTAL